MKEHKNEPREIHYELVPRRDHGRKKVSTCKLVFASVIGVIIIALIAFFLLLLFTIYLRPTPPPSYIPGKDVGLSPARAPTRRPASRGKKSLQIFVVHHRDNENRAKDVEAYLGKSVFQGDESNFELSVHALSASNMSATTLRIAILDKTFLRAGSIAVFISELLAPSATQIEKLIKNDHRTCTKFDVARCVEICSVTLQRSEPIPNMAPARVTYDSISVDVPSLVEAVQDSVIYRQLSAHQFSLTRRLRGCIEYS